MAQQALEALRPRGGAGHQFVAYGDCCSGVPGTPQAANLAAVNAMLARLTPPPEFIAFPGDQIAGANNNPEAVRRQWRYWLNEEMAWLDPTIPIYSTTSNHNTSDRAGEAVYREVWQGLPQNGPTGQKTLSYWVRRGDLLLVAVNTAYSGLGGDGHVEHAWLEQGLQEQADARYKWVLGHHPIWPVNGYRQYPLWCVVPNEGQAFWDVLVRHGVQAYLCSHIIAYDVQVQRGVLQILTGGAGTNYGPGGYMPGQTESLHAIQAALDPGGLRYQVLNPAGTLRAWLSWPPDVPAPTTWEALPGGPDALTLDPGPAPDECGARLWSWRFQGTSAAQAEGEGQTLLCGWDWDEGPVTVWVGLEGWPPRVTVRLVPEPGSGEQAWHGPTLEPSAPFDFQILLHSGMGPGGVLWRRVESEPWSSLHTSSARGAERLAWPERWHVGFSPSGSTDRPFRGSSLQISWRASTLRLE